MTAAKLKILAIDDEKDTLDALAAAIPHAFPGALVFATTDGNKGIELARAEVPDIILLDIIMPSIDGFETCRLFKEDARLKHIPIVFMTALKPDKEMLEKAFAAGAETFILKPLELWELTVQIRTMLINKAARTLQHTVHGHMEEQVTRQTIELTKALAAREKALESLTESETAYKTIFTESPMGIALVDHKTGCFLRVNPAFAGFAGRSTEKLSTIDWMKITHPDDIKTLAVNLAQLNAGKIKAFQMENRYLKPGGDVALGKLTAVPLPSFDKSSQHYLFMIEDISAAKAAEQEKAKYEEQLRQSQKMETAGRLAGGIAHDFNNILSAILVYCDFLLNALKQTDPMYKDGDEIKKAGLRAAALTRQLLVFSRKQVLQPKVLDLNPVILGMKAMLSRLLGENIKLAAVTSKTPALIKADQGYLEQVLLNLAVNARDAMPKGGKITIEASIDRVTEERIDRYGTLEPGNYVRLSVSDTGTGMSAETRSHIFEPFFTTKTSDKGTGLGLSTVHGIIKQSGGCIFVDSEPGFGTVFKVYFPLVTDDVQANGPPAPVKPMLPCDRTVLVVDDNHQIRSLVRRMLSQDGFTVIEAISAEEALAVFKRHKSPIHLILADIVLPKMNGFELAACLQAAHPGTKVIFMSGHTDHAILENGVLDPDKNFIPKPFTLDTLCRAVREALNRAGDCPAS